MYLYMYIKYVLYTHPFAYYMYMKPTSVLKHLNTKEVSFEDDRESVINTLLVSV